MALARVEGAKKRAADAALGDFSDSGIDLAYPTCTSMRLGLATSAFGIRRVRMPLL